MPLVSRRPRTPWLIRPRSRQADAAKEKPVDAKPAEKEPTVEVTMSAALAPESEEYLAQTQTALRQVLVDAGLKGSEADLFLSLYADQIFKTKETIVLFRLPSGAIEEQLPLVTYPDAKKNRPRAAGVDAQCRPQDADRAQGPCRASRRCRL